MIYLLMRVFKINNIQFFFLFKRWVIQVSCRQYKSLRQTKKKEHVPKDNRFFLETKKKTDEFIRFRLWLQYELTNSMHTSRLRRENEFVRCLFWLCARQTMHRGPEDLRHKIKTGKSLVRRRRRLFFWLGITKGFFFLIPFHFQLIYHVIAYAGMNGV